MDKKLNDFAIGLLKKEKISTPKIRISISSENKKQNSGSKKRFSDRFIPSSISKNLTNEFNTKNMRSNSNISQIGNTQIKMQSAFKPEINYQKILQTEILEENTPKFDENIGSKNVLDLFKINRKLKYQTEVKKVRKMKINRENSHDATECSSKGEAEKKIKIEKPMKSLFFENISDNFYLNTLDMFDFNKIGLGNKLGVDIIDCSKELGDSNFKRFSYDSSHEIYCVKFLNSDKLIFSDANYSIKIKDLNKEIEILKFDIIQRKFLTIDFMKNSENVLFLGSDNSCVDLYDLRQKNKVKNLYKHDNQNEVCKIKYSFRHSYVISGGNDNKINIFDLRKDNLITTLKHKAAIKGLALNDDESILASGGGTFDKCIKIWDMKKLELLGENITDSQITNLEFLPNDILVVSNGYISNNIILYNLNIDYAKTNKICSVNNLSNIPNSDYPYPILTKISAFEKHIKRILFMSKSRCNNYISTCSTDGNLRIWKTHKFMKNKQFSEESIYCGIR